MTCRPSLPTGCTTSAKLAVPARIPLQASRFIKIEEPSDVGLAEIGVDQQHAARRLRSTHRHVHRGARSAIAGARRHDHQALHAAAPTPQPWSPRCGRDRAQSRGTWRPCDRPESCPAPARGGARRDLAAVDHRDSPHKRQRSPSKARAPRSARRRYRPPPEGQSSDAGGYAASIFVALNAGSALNRRRQLRHEQCELVGDRVRERRGRGATGRRSR